jgi:transcriptional regulator with XRE-family HTH domain
VVGKKVKITLLIQNMTQTELAQRLGLRLPHLNMVVNGRRKTRWIREAIARELKRSTDELFGDDVTGF